MLHPSLIATKDIESANRNFKSSGDGEVDVQRLIAQFTSGQDPNIDENQQEYAKAILESLHVQGDEECPICFEIMDPPMVAPNCAHQT